MDKLAEIKKELEQIKKRNRKVEDDKAWETSWSRKILIAIFTYVAIGFYLYAIKIDRPWLNAIVPAIGFMLSTLTMPIFKNLWFKYLKQQ